VPREPLSLESFEDDFQAFMQGAYSRTMDEDMERLYAQRTPHKPMPCVHGKTFLTCSDCYLNGWRPKW
jgi:hypothetical protein